jgi:hypothetical protein
MKTVQINKSIVFKNAHAAFKLLYKVMTFDECLFAEWLFAKDQLKQYVKGNIINSPYLLIYHN